MSASTNQELRDLRERIARIELALGDQPHFVPMPDRSVTAIVRYAAYQMGLRAADIQGPTRSRPLFRARFAISWTARQIGRSSLTVIGEVLGGRDHTSIMNAVRRADELRERDPAFRMLTNKMLDHFTKRSS